ncbi:MAG: phosphate/phosphite/phosphonate ABC transporter substrate-binding protein [bacterium]
MAKKGNFIIGILLAAIIVALVFYPKDTPSQASSPIRTASLRKEKKEQKTLYIAFIPHIHSKKLVERWQPIEPYLENELDMPVNITTRPSYREITTALTNGDVDVCHLGSFAYILTCREIQNREIKISPLVRRIKHGTSNYHSLIVVRKDSYITDIKDLKGKKFAFTDKESTSGCLLPLVMMKKKGINPISYFSEVSFMANNSSALVAVKNNWFNAVAITDSVWQDSNQKDREDLEIFWKSEAVPLGPFCVRDDLDKELVNKIKKAFLKIGKTKDTRELAKHLRDHGGIEGFEEARDKEYEVIRKEYEVVREEYEVICEKYKDIHGGKK